MQEHAAERMELAAIGKVAQIKNLAIFERYVMSAGMSRNKVKLRSPVVML